MNAPIHIHASPISDAYNVAGEQDIFGNFYGDRVRVNMGQFQNKVSGRELSRYDFIELEEIGFKDFNRPGVFCGGSSLSC